MPISVTHKAVLYLKHSKGDLLCPNVRISLRYFKSSRSVSL